MLDQGSQLVRDNDPRTYLDIVGPLLYPREAEFNLLLGIAESLNGQPKPQVEETLLLRLMKNDRCLSAALQSPRRNLVISEIPASDVELFVSFLADRDAELPGIVGPSSSVTRFAKSWSERKAVPARLAMGQKVYELREVLPLQLPQGEFREALEAEAPKVASWLQAFCEECLPKREHLNEEQAQTAAVRSIARQDVFVWCVDDKPVAMALASRSTKNGRTISGVYTPPQDRGRGYATAVVSRLSQRILEQGKSFCSLYTDADNPTSNSIYQKIGYQEVAESTHILFEE